MVREKVVAKLLLRHHLHARNGIVWEGVIFAILGIG